MNGSKPQLDKLEGHLTLTVEVKEFTRHLERTD